MVASITSHRKNIATLPAGPTTGTHPSRALAPVLDSQQSSQQMSDEDADLLRAKRRRCAPKRYDDEDHQAAAKDLKVKSSPAESNRPQQSLLDRTASRASFQQNNFAGSYATPDDAQTLHIVQQLAARLHAHSRPELGNLFGMPDSSFGTLLSTRQVIPAEVSL